MDLITHLDKVVKLKRDPICETENRIQEALRKADPGTPEFKALLENQQQCKELRKTQRETNGLWHKLMDFLRIAVYGGGALAITFFGYCLDMESPKALKITDRGIKIIPRDKSM